MLPVGTVPSCLLSVLEGCVRCSPRRHSQPSYASVGDATSDSRHFWAGSYDGRLFVIDLQTGKIIHRLAPGGLIAGVRVSPDGSKVYVSSSGTSNPLLTPVVLAVDLLWAKLVPGPGSTKIYDAHTYAQIGDIPTGRVPTTINLPPARP